MFFPSSQLEKGQNTVNMSLSAKQRKNTHNNVLWKLFFMLSTCLYYFCTQSFQNILKDYKSGFSEQAKKLQHSLG